MNEPAHLRVYRFDPGSTFEGGLLGAIERSSSAVTRSCTTPCS
jgi:hypothetical protein